jgi:hypothetical protein
MFGYGVAIWRPARWKALSGRGFIASGRFTAADLFIGANDFVRVQPARAAAGVHRLCGAR